MACLGSEIPPKKFMWVQSLCSFCVLFHEIEAHQLLSLVGGGKMGLWVGAKKFMCFFHPLLGGAVGLWLGCNVATLGPQRDLRGRSFRTCWHSEL